MEDEYLNALSDIDETLADVTESNQKTSDAVDDFSSDMTNDAPSKAEVPEEEIDDIAQQNVIKSDNSNEEILNHLTDLINVSSNTEELQEEELDTHEEYYKKLLAQLEELNATAAISSDVDPETMDTAQLNESITTLVENNSDSNSELITQLGESAENDENDAETQMYLDMMNSIDLDTANVDAPIDTTAELSTAEPIVDNVEVQDESTDIELDNQTADAAPTNVGSAEDPSTIQSDDIVEQDTAVEQINEIATSNDKIVLDDEDYDDDDDDDDYDEEEYDTFTLGDVQNLGKTDAELDNVAESTLDPAVVSESNVEPDTLSNVDYDDESIENTEDSPKAKLPSLISRVSEEDEMAMLFSSMKSKNKKDEEADDVIDDNIDAADKVAETIDIIEDEDIIDDTEEVDDIAESFETMQEDSAKLTKALEESINETQISNELSTEQAEQLNDTLEQTAVVSEDLNEQAISDEQIVEEKEETPTIIEKDLAPETIKAEDAPTPVEETPTTNNTIDVKEEAPKQEQQSSNTINNTESNVTQQTQSFDKMEELLTNLIHLNAKMLEIQMKNANVKSIHKLKNGPISN